VLTRPEGRHGRQVISISSMRESGSCSSSLRTSCYIRYVIRSESASAKREPMLSQSCGSWVIQRSRSRSAAFILHPKRLNWAYERLTAMNLRRLPHKFPRSPARRFRKLIVFNVPEVTKSADATD